MLVAQRNLRSALATIDEATAPLPKTRFLLNTHVTEIRSDDVIDDALTEIAASLSGLTA